MSRTDKDRPWVIRAADRSDNNPSYPYHSLQRHLDGQCDLLDENTSRHPRPFTHRRCQWQIPYTVFCGNVPGWYTHITWWGPQRLRERDQLRSLRDEYNTYGDLADDGDFPNLHHRHEARRSWY